MKKKPKKKSEWQKYKDFCFKEYEYIINNILADDWTFSLNVVNYIDSSINEYSAVAHTDYTYRRHDIKVYKKTFSNCWPRDKRQIRIILLHEFCHHYVTPIVDIVMEGNPRSDMLQVIDERTTEILAKNFYELLYDSNGKKIKK